MAHVPIQSLPDKAVRFPDLERNRPIGSEVGMRSMKEPQAERQEKAPGDQRKRMKGEVRKGEPRRRNPYASSLVSFVVAQRRMSS
jgi:hypothetical protein